MVEKILNGLIIRFILCPEDLGDASTLWVGSKAIDLVGGWLTLGPEIPYAEEAKGNRAFHLYPLQRSGLVMRDIVKVVPLVRGLGSGQPFDKKSAKGPNFIVRMVMSDLKRNQNTWAFLPEDVLPEPDLVQVAHHYMDSLPTCFHDRLRLVAGALHGATIRLATTCSGLETMPSILNAIFRP